MVLFARRLEARVERSLRTIGLSMRKLGLLGHLSREPGISYSALARRAGIKVQSLHPIMDELTRDGLVVTVGEGGQGRAAVIELTERGRDTLARANELISDVDTDVFAQADWFDVDRAMSALGELVQRDRDAPPSSAE
jgi:DNA-binding MarR family transcriptional regulator